MRHMRRKHWKELLPHVAKQLKLKVDAADLTPEKLAQYQRHKVL